MQSDILQRFLDQGLLDLGEDPERFGYLKAAADDVAKRLQEDRRSLVTGASVLMGGELDDPEPILELCKNAITQHWPTYRSRFPSNTAQLFRATLLQAIARITEQDPDCSSTAIVFYSTSGTLPYLVTKREDEIFREFLLGLGDKVETEAERLWAAPRSLAQTTVKYDTSVPAIPSIDSKVLKEALKGAAGPSGAAGANPEWPSANSPTWLDNFGQGAANAISASAAALLQDLIPKILAQSRKDVGTALEVIKVALSSGAGDNLRADLLYWKEALFSPTRKLSYRQMPDDSAVYWTAHDLHVRVPRFHPQSVEFFLRETVRMAVGDKEAKKKVTVEQFSSGLADDSKHILLPYDIVAGQRLTVLDAIEGAVTKRIKASAASTQAGIPAETLLPREELAVLLFRDFQVRRLAGGK